MQTVLTTPIGRIIDVLQVIRMGDALWVLTSPVNSVLSIVTSRKTFFLMTTSPLPLPPVATAESHFMVLVPRRLWRN
jgi:hypothetical protein